MHAAFQDGWGNASSTHTLGQRARAYVERARIALATSIRAKPADIVLTSGGTEACNLMIQGLPKPSRVITSSVEHPAVHAAIDALGVEVVCLSFRPTLQEFQDALQDNALVVFQYVNHETGVILPIKEYSSIARKAGAIFVVDGIQAFGRFSIDMSFLDVDAFAVASHKVGGPSGVGALWVRRGVPLEGIIRGGSQERGRRGGTQDAISLAGFAAACERIDNRIAEMKKILMWRDRLETALRQLGAKINGDECPRVASVVNASLKKWRSELLVAALDLEGLCVSAGAACSSGLAQSSPTLEAMYPQELWRARSALRLSLGPEGLDEQSIEQAIAILQKVIPRAG